MGPAPRTSLRQTAPLKAPSRRLTGSRAFKENLAILKRSEEMQEERLRLLLDRMEISDVIYRYASSIDMRDWDSYRSCFTEEIEVEVPFFRGGSPTVLPADEWVEAVRRGLSGLQATQHISTNHQITVRGDEATCISYMYVTHYLPSQRGEDFWIIGGYYTTRLVRTPLGWRIRGFRQTVTWSRGDRSILALARQRSRDTHEERPGG